MSVFISPFNLVYNVAGTSHVNGNRLHETLRNVLSMHSIRPLADILGTDPLGTNASENLFFHAGLEYGS